MITQDLISDTVKIQYIQKQCASIFTVSGKVVRHSLACLIVHKWLVGDVLFYLHCMQRCIGDGKAVRRSDKRVNCDKTNETSAQILNHMHDRCIYFCGVRLVGGNVPLYLKFWAKLAHSLQKRRLPIDIRWQPLSRDIYSEKSLFTTNGNSTRGFLMSLK